ncbi:MAG: FAD-dependent oxidoreductase [Candidatus Omnitrophica bacterium]|nr:FAD-dependent oxidoreductase [Candidatus Omnitrophota bacterium]
MEIKSDILVIGSGPAGLISASTARRYYPSKKIAVITKTDLSIIPCGIPYMFSSLSSPDDNLCAVEGLKKKGTDIYIDEIKQVLPDKKEAVGENTYSYEKLVLATGSKPLRPPIKGIDKEGVFFVYKEMHYLKNMIEQLKSWRNVLIIGGGFIGVELADELSKHKHLHIFLVEAQEEVLSNSFDKEFSLLARDKLVSEGVEIITGDVVSEIAGGKKAEQVRLQSGRTLDVDAVIVGIGAVPNTELAEKAGIDLGRGKGIWVDEYMRTSVKDIFAVGDCAGKRDFFTRRDCRVMLASTATAEARVAGANLYQLKIVRENKGTIAIFSTYVNGLVLGSAGLTEKTAKQEGFDVVVGQAEGVDRHPASLPGASKIKVKLIFSRHSGIILGGQVSGGASCGELINIIGLAIQKRVSFSELETFQMATHPYLTSAPTMYSLVLAAQNAGDNF